MAMICRPSGIGSGRGRIGLLACLGRPWLSNGMEETGREAYSTADCMRILVLNGGSSSFKCWYGELRDPVPVEAQRPQWESRLDWSRQARVADFKIELDPVLKALEAPVYVVGHR